MTIVAFLISFVTEAQDLIWHHGSVVLANNQVLVGNVSRGGFDLLLLKDDAGAVTVYPAHKVSSFRYYDEAHQINRSFVTIRNKYYERVVVGKISVFRIQKFFDEKINESNADAFDFFIEAEKRIFSIKQFRKKFFDYVREELELRMIPYRNLDPNTRHGALSLIVLYNGKPVPAAI